MRTMKSKDARANWSAILRDAEHGLTTVIEQYNRPVARIVPYEPPRLRAVASTYNDRSGAMVTIQGVQAPDYVDGSPGARAHRSETEGWVLQDDNDQRTVTAPTLEEAIMAWAQRLGHRLHVIVVDPVYPPDPDAGPDDW